MENEADVELSGLAKNRDYTAAADLDSRTQVRNESDDDGSHHFSQQYPPVQDSTSQQRLSYPVIIPQHRPENKSRGWMRGYAPALMDCGIDQQSFLYFLDSFNEASKVSQLFPRMFLQEIYLQMMDRFKKQI